MHVLGEIRKFLYIYEVCLLGQCVGVVLALSAESGKQSGLRNEYFSFYSKDGLWTKNSTFVLATF